MVLDLRGISSFTDFFLICSATSEPHLKALINDLADRLRKEHGIRAVAVDGFPLSQWIVADFGGVVIHLFHQAKREYYALEDLWSDAPRLKLAPPKPPAPAKKPRAPRATRAKAGDAPAPAAPKPKKPRAPRKTKAAE